MLGREIAKPLGLGRIRVICEGQVSHPSVAGYGNGWGQWLARQNEGSVALLSTRYSYLAASQLGQEVGKYLIY